MLEQISQTLSKPFPFSQNSTQGAGISAFFGVFIFVFLAIFQPYGLSEITTHKYMFLFGYGVITFCVIFCTSVLLSYTLNKTIIEKWTVGRSISLISLEILLIGLLNWTYTFLFGDENINHYSLLDFVLFTMEVALIPSGFFIILFERLLQRKNKEKASILSSTLSTPKVNNDQKTKISLGLNQHQFTVDLSKLLCIKAQGNYMEVYYLLNESIKKQLVRQTLSGISKQLLEDTSLGKF